MGVFDKTIYDRTFQGTCHAACLLDEAVVSLSSFLQAYFHPWALGIIHEALNNGDAAIEMADVRGCQGCDAVRSYEGGTCTKECAKCGDSKTYATQRPSLIGHVDETVRALATTCSGVDQRTTIFGARLLNKERLGGVRLDALGLDGQVLDPKIGIGMLGLYAAILSEADSVDLIASRATAANNLTNFFALIKTQTSDLPRLRMKPIVKVPIHHIQHQREVGLLDDNKLEEMMTEKLPPHLISMRHDMSPETFDRILFCRKRPIT